MADIMECDIPPADTIISSKALHHVPSNNLPKLLERIVHALSPSGCFILLDHMGLGPNWGDNVRGQSRRIYKKHVNDAVEAGRATQDEIDARWDFKKQMKAAGKDAEYSHTADEILGAMQDAGFEEMGIVWRMFADTVLVGFAPGS